jgi:hypothetical protein
MTAARSGKPSVPGECASSKMVLDLIGKKPAQVRPLPPATNFRCVNSIRVAASDFFFKTPQNKTIGAKALLEFKGRAAKLI